MEESDLQNGNANAVAAFVQHTDYFAMEYSVGGQSAQTKEFSSWLSLNAIRATGLLSMQPRESVVVQVGGGLSMIAAFYQASAEELRDLASFGIFDAEQDISPALGFHLQGQATWQASSKFSIGVFVRYTEVEADNIVNFNDGSTLFSLDGEVDLGGFEYGISIGAVFGPGGDAPARPKKRRPVDVGEEGDYYR